MSTINELIHEIDAGTISDARRRELLVAATGLVGGVGLLATAYPFREPGAIGP